MTLAVWSFIISVIAIGASIFTIAQKIYEKRMEIKISVDSKSDYVAKIEPINKTYNVFTIPCFIENLTESTVAITQILIMDTTGKTYRAELFPNFIAHRFNRLIDTNNFYEKIIESALFPINLTGLEATYQFIEFKLPRKSITVKNIEIFTNKKNTTMNNLVMPIQNILDNTQSTTINSNFSYVREVNGDLQAER